MCIFLVYGIDQNGYLFFCPNINWLLYTAQHVDFSKTITLFSLSSNSSPLSNNSTYSQYHGVVIIDQLLNYKAVMTNLVLN